MNDGFSSRRARREAGLSAGGVPIVHPARRPSTYPSLMSSLKSAQGAITDRCLCDVDLSGGLFPFVASGEGRCPGLP